MKKILFLLVAIVLFSLPAKAQIELIPALSSVSDYVVSGLTNDGTVDESADIKAFMEAHDGWAVLPPGKYKLRNLAWEPGQAGTTQDVFHLVPQYPGTVTLVQDNDSPLITLDGSEVVSSDFTVTAIDTVTVHGPQNTISSISANSGNARVTTSGSHGYSVGNKVNFLIRTGMLELNNYICTIGAVTGTTFDCTGLDITGFTTFTAGKVEKYDDPDNNEDNVTELTYTGTLPSWVGKGTYGIVGSENMFLGEDTLAINSITKGATTTIEVMSPFSLSSTPGSSHWGNGNKAVFDYVTGIPELDNASHNVIGTISSLNTSTKTFVVDIDTSASTGSFRTVRKKITAITQANPAVVTYSGDDTIYGKTVANGDILELRVTGMKAINGQCTVANVNTGANTFECSGIDSRAYAAFSAGYIAPLPITNITKAAPGVVTTKFAHGLSNGDVINMVIDGMDEMDGTCTILNKTATTFQCNNGSGTGIDTTLYTSFADGYIGDEGYTTVHKSVTWMQEPVQVMQVFSGSNKILLNNNIFFADRFTRSPKVTFINDAYHAVLGDFNIETPDHATFDWLDSSLPDKQSTIAMTALARPEFGHLRFNGYWTTGLYRSSVLGMKIKSLDFYGGLNDLSAVYTTFGYGLRDDGSSGFNLTDNLWSSAMNRHAKTTGGCNGTGSTVVNNTGQMYAACPQFRRGYNRFNVVSTMTCHNANGMCDDTHEQTVDSYVGSLYVTNAITGPTAYGSGSAGGISNRSINPQYGTVSIKGAKFGINSQGVEHGVMNTVSIGTLDLVSAPTGKDQDVAVRSEDMSGLSRPFVMNIGTLQVDNYGKGFLIQDGPQELNIGLYKARRVDRAGQLSPGATATIAETDLDYRYNERQPTSTGFLLTCDSTSGGAELNFGSPPRITFGNTASKPTSLVTASGSSCSNSLSIPGITINNPFNITIPTLITDATNLTVVTGNSTIVRRVAEYCYPISDFTTTTITAANGLADEYPFSQNFYVTGVRAYTRTQPTGLMTIDINEGGTTILSTKLTIDANEDDSSTAAAKAIISDHSIAANANLTVDVDSTTGGKGGVVCLQGF